MAGPPAEIVSQLAASGAHQLYVDGRWWDHDSRVPARGAHSASHYHSRACAHWRRSSSLRHPAARRAAPSRSDSALSERLGFERVRCGRLLAARGERPAAFGRRRIPPGCVAPPSNIPDAGYLLDSGDPNI
jgi:hypothetical protein